MVCAAGARKAERRGGLFDIFGHNLQPPSLSTLAQLLLAYRYSKSWSWVHGALKSPMNGFAESGLSEEAFGASKGGLSSFDAFRKFIL